MTLDEYIRTLEAAPATIARENARLLANTIEDLKDYGQSIGHERSGYMDETMHVRGPDSGADGELEASFESDASYAELEVARGGSHDWATRTLNEQRARITQLQLDVENATVRALVGGS